MRSKTKSHGFGSDSSKRCDVQRVRVRLDWLGTDVWYSTVLWVYWMKGPPKKTRSTDLILVLILLRHLTNSFQTLARLVLCAKYLSTF